MQKLFSKLIDLIYDNPCLICKKYSKQSIVCKSCENSFTPREQNYTKYFQEVTVFSWGLYEGNLREGIIRLKAGKKGLAAYFSKKLLVLWKKIPSNFKNENCLVIPVPSHKKRIMVRGYCQSSLMGKEFAKNLGFGFTNNFVIRKKETQYMNSLANINERIENIKNAFEVAGILEEQKNTVIIDDILTSGSTICELARTIHQKYPNVTLTGLTIASGDTYN